MWVIYAYECVSARRPLFWALLECWIQALGLHTVRRTAAFCVRGCVCLYTFDLHVCKDCKQCFPIFIFTFLRRVPEVQHGTKKKPNKEVVKYSILQVCLVLFDEAVRSKNDACPCRLSLNQVIVIFSTPSTSAE